jgi:tRNA(Ile)-lysidine synthase
MTPFIERLYTYINEKKLIEKNDRVCVGVSGGADSLCLLVLLHELSGRLGIEVCAFHVDHHLRGEESGADRAFVEEFCRQRGIPLKVYDFEVASLASENKKSLEEMGRIVRKKAAADFMKESGANKTALAHHLNDCAETLLFNLARGTSIAGLKGIAPKNGNVIRPLLIFGRSEIEDELRSRNIGWRTDSTNLKDEYSRNKLRLNILPYFEENINAGSVRHMAAAARDMEEADEIISALAEEKAAALVSQYKDGLLISTAVSAEKELISGYIILGTLKRLTDNVTDIKRLHIDNIRRLLEGQSGKSIDLPYGIRADRIYEGVLLAKKKTGKKARQADCKAVKLALNERTRFGDFVFETRLFSASAVAGEIPKKKYTKWFDYDKLTGNPVLRYKQGGDYFVIDKPGHKKKLKKYFTDEKIPKEERDSIVCVADGSRIIWAVGCRIGEDCKIDSSTSRIIEITCRGADEV